MLGSFDVAIFRFMNGTLASPALDAAAPFLTMAGAGEFIFIMAFLLLIFCRREKKLSGVLLLAGLTVTYFVTEFLKGVFAVPRPFVSLPGVRLIVPESAGYSFPSGHAAVAFMAAVVAAAYFKPRTLWFILAALAALSRVYVGVHYISDVAGGAFIGIIIGYGLVRISRYSNNG